MPRENARWQTRQMITPEHQELARLSGCHPIVAALLAARGYSRPEELRLFFDGCLSQLPAPSLMKDLVPARDRIVHAIRAGEKITVYGDYDVDGITATTTLLIGLRRLGGSVDCHIPDRCSEGYGLNCDALRAIAAKGASVVVSVDCGISARDEATYAREIGIDLVVTDHHQPPPDRIDALAVVNPKQKGCVYPFKELTGVGVAYQLLSAVREVLAPDTSIEDLLELVAMGTIADVVPLTGPNRIMVREGLRRLAQTKNIGLRALLASAGLEGRPVSAGHVAFALAPRINACGRIGHAHQAVELLLTEDQLRAKALAEELEQLNNQRQALEQGILEEAQSMVQSDPNWRQQRAVVLGSEAWHPGVIGIVASRLVEAFHRPVILFSFDGETAKGSGRSIKGFDLYQALADHSQYLTKYGGHELAAGLSLDRGRFEAFRAAFLNYAQSTLSDDDLVPVVQADVEIDPTQVSLELVDQLVKMEPFGMGNPSPVFMLRGMSAMYTRELSQGKHFRARVKGGDTILDAVAWRMGEQIADFCGYLDLVASLERNDYNGQSSVQLVVRDWRASEVARTALANGITRTVAEVGESWIYCREQRELDLLREQFGLKPLNDETAAGLAVGHPILPGGVFVHVCGRRLETIVTDCPQTRADEPLLLLNLPYEPVAAAHLTLLFGKEEIPRAKEKLLWLLPDRDHLAAAFRWLRTAGPVDFETMIAMLVQRGLELREGRSAAQTIAGIFVELGLLRACGGRLQLVEASAPVELTKSAIFRQAQEKRQIVLRWYEQIEAEWSTTSSRTGLHHAGTSTIGYQPY